MAGRSRRMRGRRPVHFRRKLANSLADLHRNMLGFQAVAGSPAVAPVRQRHGRAPRQAIGQASDPFGRCASPAATAPRPRQAHRSARRRRRRSCRPRDSADRPACGPAMSPCLRYACAADGQRIPAACRRSRAPAHRSTWSGWCRPRSRRSARRSRHSDWNRYSSRPPLAKMLICGNPAASSMPRTALAWVPRSPLSSRTALTEMPCAARRGASLATTVAPQSVKEFRRELERRFQPRQFVLRELDSLQELYHLFETGRPPGSPAVLAVPARTAQRQPSPSCRAPHRPQAWKVRTGRSAADCAQAFVSTPEY